MVARNKLQEAPPYPIEQSLKHLGKNLRAARQYRHLTIAEVAEKIGTGSRNTVQFGILNRCTFTVIIARRSASLAFV